MRTLFTPFGLACLLTGLSVPALAGAAQRIDCHVTYGGETRVHSATHVDSPYGVEAVAVGSYFLFKLVFQARPGQGITGLMNGHRGEHGFTGLQRVYEPVRDSEREFWCEQRAEVQR